MRAGPPWSLGAGAGRKTRIIWLDERLGARHPLFFSSFLRRARRYRQRVNAVGKLICKEAIN